MSETSKYQNQFNFNQEVGNVNTGDITIKRNQIGIQHNEASERTLAESAKEIKNLLAQLQTTYPPKTNEEKQVLVTKFNEEIETNSRVRKILLAGGIELIKMICPPLGIPIEMGKQWLETAKRDLGK